MTQIPDRRVLSANLAESGALLEQLQRGVELQRLDAGGNVVGRKRTPGIESLLEMVQAAARVGHRCRSGAEPGGPVTVLDDQGSAMPPVSDPVGELVVGRRVVDPIAYNAETVFRCLEGALGDLRLAVGALAKVFRDTALQEGEPGCSSCARIGHYNPILYRGARCRFCYDFWLAEGIDPPVELVKARSEGRYITPKMMADAKAAAHRPRVRSKKRRAHPAQPLPGDMRA